MGILSRISEIKENFKKKQRLASDVRLLSNQQKLTQLRKERQDLQIKEDTRKELQTEQAKIRELKTARLKEGINQFKSFIPKRANVRTNTKAIKSNKRKIIKPYTPGGVFSQPIGSSPFTQNSNNNKPFKL